MDVGGGIAGLDENIKLDAGQMGLINPVIVSSFESGTDIYHSHDADASTTLDTLTKLKTITLPFSPNDTLRINYNTETGTWYGSSQIYRNGVAVGASNYSEYDDTTEFTQNISGWSAGDTIELYGRTTGAGNPFTVRNLRILCDKTSISNS
jgi:hypothetical protein